MSTKRYILPDQESISISGNAAEKLIRRGDGSAALLYIYMLKSKGNLSIPEAQNALGFTEQQVYDAMGSLRAMGMISGGGGTERKDSPPDTEELPDYTAEEITREMDSQSDFSMLSQEVQRCLGKPLTSNDLKILLGLYQHLQMPSEVILLLISCCIEEHQDKYGTGKFPTMRGVERVAYIWARTGVLTLEEAMRYLKKRSVQKSAAGEISRVLQLKNDTLTETQKKYIYRWLDMGFRAEEVARGYDRTLVNTGELKWNYLDKILTNWHEKGLHTIEEIEEKDGKSSRGKAKSGQKAAAIKPDRGEIDRKKRIIEELKRQS